MSETKKINSLRVYGVGGAGLNIVSRLSLPSEAAGFPVSHFGLIDTSRSNMPPKHSDKGEIFLVPGIDGAGKSREFAYRQSKPHVDAMMLKCPPKDFNIVVFGMSGGSGSVLGPLVIEELLKRGESVIGIGIISNSSAIENKNAYDTLGDLQKIAVNKLQTPIVCNIYENGEETDSFMVDDLIESNIRALAMLVSGTNNGLDTKDVNNWLHFNKVTKVAPQLVDLVVYLEGKDNMQVDDISPIAVASLLPKPEHQLLTLGQLYNCFGRCSESAITATTHEIPPMHFIITNQFMGERMRKLKSVVADFKKSEEKILTTEIPTFDDEEESVSLFD